VPPGSGSSRNIGAAEVSGVDIQAGCTLGAKPGRDSPASALNGACLLSTLTQPLPGAHTCDCAGLFGSTCQTVNPQWHHVFRTTWQTPWTWSISLTWRYLSSGRLGNNDADPTLQFADPGAYDFFDARLPSFRCFDLAGNGSVNKTFERRAGIRNALDKDPPLATFEITSGGAANTYSTCDALGRQVFSAFTAKF
jgi:iron complex outermembrane recepter protein